MMVVMVMVHPAAKHPPSPTPLVTFHGYDTSMFRVHWYFPISSVINICLLIFTGPIS